MVLQILERRVLSPSVMAGRRVRSKARNPRKESCQRQALTNTGEMDEAVSRHGLMPSMRITLLLKEARVFHLETCIV